MKQDVTSVALQEYLDAAIAEWRKKRDTASGLEERTMATHYIDAFQSVRVSMLGALNEG